MLEFSILAVSAPAMLGLGRRRTQGVAEACPNFLVRTWTQGVSDQPSDCCGTEMPCVLMPGHLLSTIVMLRDNDVVEMTGDLQATFLAVGTISYTERLFHPRLQRP